MNVKLVRAALFVSLLLVSLTMGVHVAKADSDDYIRFYAFTLYSPLERTYNPRGLTLNLSFTAGLGIRYSLYYYIDGKYMDVIPFSVKGTSEMHVTYPASGFAELPILPDGPHSLTVFFICSGLIRSLPSNIETVHFTIDSNAPYQLQPPPTPDSSPPSVANPQADTTPPSISDLSLENKTYLAPNVPLNFTVNENTSQVTYSLDGKDNVTIAGNVTLTGLLVGAHNLTIYSWDNSGNVGASKTVNFEVTNKTPVALGPSEPFSTTVIATLSGVSAVFVSVGLLVYFRKRAVTNRNDAVKKT
jgi:hypothetical protein